MLLMICADLVQNDRQSIAIGLHITLLLDSPREAWSTVAKTTEAKEAPARILTLDYVHHRIFDASIPVLQVSVYPN